MCCFIKVFNKIRFVPCAIVSHLFPNCPITSFLWKKIQKELHVHCLPVDTSELWRGWRRAHVSQSVRLEWDFLSAMAIIWLVWHERNSHIFLQKIKPNSSILASIHSFVAFWLENLSCKKWKTFVRRKGPKGVVGLKAMHNRQPAEVSNEQDNRSVQGDGEETQAGHSELLNAEVAVEDQAERGGSM